MSVSTLIVEFLVAAAALVGLLAVMTVTVRFSTRRSINAVAEEELDRQALKRSFDRALEARDAIETLRRDLHNELEEQQKRLDAIEARLDRICETLHCQP